MIIQLPKNPLNNVVTKSWSENFGERLSNFQQKVFGHFPSRKFQNFNQKGRRILENRLFQEKLCLQFRKFQPRRLGCQDSLVSSSAVSFTVTELPVASVAEEWPLGCLGRWFRSISKLRYQRISRYLQTFC